MKKYLLSIIFAVMFFTANAQTVIDSLVSVIIDIENTKPFDEKKYSENVNSLIFCLLSISDYYNAQIACDNGYNFLYANGSGPNTEYLRTLIQYSARIDQALMNYDQAISKYNTVIEMCDAASVPEEDYIVVYQNLAMAYFFMQNYKKMKEYMDISVAKFEEIFGSIFEIHNEQFFLLLNNYGTANLYNGQPALAEKCFKYVIDNCKDSFESNNAYPLALSNYAFMLLQNHKYKQAEQLLLKANSNNSDYSLKIVENLIATYFARCQNKKMCESLLLYNQIAAQSAANIMSEFPKGEWDNYWGKISYDMLLLNNFVAIFNEKTNAPEIAYNATLFCRNLLANSEKIIANEVAKTSDNQLKSKYKKMKELEREYTFQTSDLRSKDSLKCEIKNLDDDILRALNGLDSLLVNSSKIWIDVKNSLDKGEYAVEYSYLLFPSFDDNGQINENGQADTTYCALVVGKGFKRPLLTILSSIKPLDSLLFNKLDNAIDNNFVYVQKTTSLYNSLFRNVEKLIPDANTIYYSPCGKLSLLNFELFTDDTGKPLNQKYKMVRVSSTANIPEIKSLDIKSFKTSALYGGIDYKNSITNSDVAVRGVDFRNLPNTGTEIKSVAKILTASNIKTDTICGENATEESFKKLSGNSPDILHIATHGFYLEDDSDKPFAQSVNTYSKKESAMALSGLALSGANNAWKGNFDLPNVEDGILTAYEISQLDLSNTKLVVLSACETARGRIFPVDGVFGLQRAFKQADAGSILMSLWKVDDNATATFMEYFYKFLFETNDRHEALKKAQDEVRKQYPDPYYWAAWVMLD